MIDFEEDRLEIIKHWDRLNLFYRFVVLFLFSILNRRKIESITYLLDRLYVRPDRMICLSHTETVSHWDNIKSFLTRKLLNRSKES